MAAGKSGGVCGMGRFVGIVVLAATAAVLGFSSAAMAQRGGQRPLTRAEATFQKVVDQYNGERVPEKIASGCLDLNTKLRFLKLTEDAMSQLSISTNEFTTMRAMNATVERTPVCGWVAFGAVPTGLSVSGSFGGAQVINYFSVYQLGSANSFDVVGGNQIYPTSSGAFGGFNVAVTSDPLPLEYLASHAPRRPRDANFTNVPAFAFGIEFGMDFFGNNSATIQGLPGSLFLPATNSDSFNINTRRLTHVAAAFHVGTNYGGMPIDTFFKAGAAGVTREVTYNCAGPGVGFCGVSPATLPFSATQTTTTWGGYWGVGVGTTIPAF